MSVLDQVRAKYGASGDRAAKLSSEGYEHLRAGPDKTDKSPSVSSVSLHTRDSENFTTPESGVLPFDQRRMRRAGERLRQARQSRLDEAEAMLAAAPAPVRYAYRTYADAHPEFVVVALAIRGIGACELSVSQEKYDPAKFIELLTGGRP